MPGTSTTTSSGSTVAEARSKVVAAAKAYVDRGNPYAWGGKGQALTDSNITDLSNQYGSDKYSHLRSGGAAYDKVNQPGYECVDCSGLTARVYKSVLGVNIGAGTGSQINYSTGIGLANAQPGDLLVNDHHAAIMGDNGKMIEAKGAAWGCTNDRAPSSDMKAMRVVNDNSTIVSGGTSAVSTSEAAGFDVDGAVAYNRGMGYSYSTWIMIQQTVGTSADGDPGPNTAKAIYNWQKTHNLHPDGECGPKTLAAIKNASAGGSSSTTTTTTTATTTTTTPTTTTTTVSVNINESAAVSYNRSHYNNSTWRTIQGIVGTDVDGDPGPKTARAVAQWQASHGLEIDGKCGPITYDSVMNGGSSAAVTTPAVTTPAVTTPADTTPAATTPETTTPEVTTPSGSSTISVGSEYYSGSDNVSYGANNNKVRALQLLLNYHKAGRYGNDLGVDGSFGKGTATALMRFQYHHVKKNAGVFFKSTASSKSVCDAETWAELRKSSPTVVNQKGLAISFVNGEAQSSSETPNTDIYCGSKQCGKLSANAAANFNNMAAASQSSSSPITGISSSFRGMTDEATVAATGGVGGSEGAIELYVDRDFNTGLAATPGYSNHCKGNAVDIAGFGSRTAKPAIWYWLNSNAASYNFHPYDYETWHWNYY